MDKIFKIIKLADSAYKNQLEHLDDEYIYCEIQCQRDRSSFAGIALKITNQKNFIYVSPKEEKIAKISKYEKIYVGCEQDYINSVKESFALEERDYGVEVLFLVYSDLRSSKIIFEILMENIDQKIGKIKQK